MHWQYTPYILPLAIAVFISAALSFMAWRRRETIGSRSFGVLTFALVQWSFTYIMELASVREADKIFWTNFQYLGITTVPAAWLAFALEYTGQQRWLTRRNILLLAIEPLLTQLAAWTDGYHHLFRVSIGLDTTGGYPALAATFGPAFWLHGLYSYVLLLVGTVLLFRAHLRSPRLYRRQTLALLIASLVPWIANAIFLAGLSPFPNLDLTPFAFTISVAAMAWGVLRFQLLDVVPVARAAVVEGMRDGVMVLDIQNRVVDINPMGQQIVGRADVEVIGRPVREVLSAFFELVERYTGVADASDEVTLGEGAAQRNYDLRISPLYDTRQQFLGRLVVLRDITERKRADAERERLIAELDAFAHTVAHDLKNPLTMTLAASKLLQHQHADALDEQSLQLLDIIARGSHKMGAIIDALLLLAGVGQVSVVPLEPLDSAAIVQEALQRLGYLVAERQAEIVLPERWPQALGYAPWIEEVWANYLSNAIKYGGDPPRLELGWDWGKAEGGRLKDEDENESLPGVADSAFSLHNSSFLRFWVRDNGAGLTPEEQTRLFTPFTRLGQARIEGHGLGLSIVQRILEKLGGEVGVESAPGRGSTFWFTLPQAASRK